MDAVVALQGWIYNSIGGFLGSFAAEHDWGALLAVLPLGVTFGAIHAMTPGHSKLVLASYLAGARLAAFRSITVASVLSLTHVGSAVIFALIAAPLFTRTFGNAGRAPTLEILMFAALARGVPQAGLVFAATMMIGVTITLAALALTTVLAREFITRVVQQAGASIARVSRALDVMSALLLLAVAAYELLTLLGRRP